MQKTTNRVSQTDSSMKASAALLGLFSLIFLFACATFDLAAHPVSVQVEGGYDTNVLEQHAPRLREPYLRIYLNFPWQFAPTGRLRVHYTHRAALTRWHEQSALTNRALLRTSYPFPYRMTLESRFQVQHNTPLHLKQEATPLKPSYAWLDAGLALKRTFGSWSFGAGHNRRQLRTTPYMATDARWEAYLLHHFSIPLGLRINWQQHHLVYHPTDEPSEEARITERIDAAVTEWRVTLPIRSMGLWSPFWVYERTVQGSRTFVARRLGILGGMHLGRDWSVQLYAFMQRRPGRFVLPRDGQDEQELLAEQQQSSVAIDVWRRIRTQSSVGFRWRWYQDEDGEGQSIARQVFAFSYRHYLGE